MDTSINKVKFEHKIILDLVEAGSSVLDLGCGDGELLGLLINKKNVKAQGIEIDEKAIYSCVEKGLSVFHGDLDSGLADYADGTFDYVILDQTMQELRHPDTVLDRSLRVGRRVIVVFPNFAYYKGRFQLFLKGRVPVTPSLPHTWYDTPNLHFLSFFDFIDYCKKRNITIEKSIFLSGEKIIKFLPNLRAGVGIFVIRKA